MVGVPHCGRDRQTHGSGETLGAPQTTAAQLWEQRSGGSGILHPVAEPLHPSNGLLLSAPRSGPQGLRTAHLSLAPFQLHQVFLFP